MARPTARVWIGSALFLVALLASEAFLFLLFAEDRGAEGGVLDDLPVIGILLAVLLTMVAVVLLLFIILWFRRDPDATADGDQPFFIPEEGHYDDLGDWDDEGTAAGGVEFQDAPADPAPAPTEPAPFDAGGDDWTTPANDNMAYEPTAVDAPVADASGSSAVTTTTTTTTTTSVAEPAWIPSEDHHIGDGMATYELPAMPLATKSWGKAQATAEGDVYPFYFPRNVDRGIYVNDYVDIGGGTRLKLRTLLAGASDIGVQNGAANAPAPLPATAPAAPAAPVTPTVPVPTPIATQPDVPPTPVPTAEPAPVAPVVPAAAPPEPADEWAPAAPAPATPSSTSPIRDVEAAVDHLGAPPATTVTTTTVASSRTVTREGDAFYDFPGDIVDIQELEGLGPTNARKLRGAGVHTTSRLMYEDPTRLAVASGVAESKIRAWQAMIELEKVSGIGPHFAHTLAEAGITGVDELKKRSAQSIADQIQDGSIGAKRIAGWQEAAKEMRRVKKTTPNK